MRLGFICEGETEKKIVESPNFQQFLNSLSHTCIPDIIDAQGKDNLLPKWLPQFSQRLIDKGAEKIIILTDLDEDACIAITKQRINAPQNHFVIISIKQIEAWFLADSQCLTTVCNKSLCFVFPENENNPFQTIRELLVEHTGRGIPRKILLASRMLNNNFSIVNAAKHPNCKSAKYFIEKLKSLQVEKVNFFLSLLYDLKRWVHTKLSFNVKTSLKF